MSSSAPPKSLIVGSTAAEAALRIGIVCPYALDSPGGVQAHIRDLAEALRDLGHDVTILAPMDNEGDVPAGVVSLGKTIAVPYNGSVARVAFGPRTLNRVRRALKTGQFDVLHLHDPSAPSVSMLACLVATGPIVATFHIAKHRSRAVAAAHSALQPLFEKITGRIAVSALARRFQVEHFDGGGVEIPNGVAVSRFRDAEPLPGWPGEGGAVGFLGRFNEPRKGFDVLLRAFAELAPLRPGLRLLVAGPGDPEAALAGVPGGVRDRIIMLGSVSEVDKARMLRSVDVYVAPNTGGESFGIVLTEAMAAGACVLASDLDAFVSVLRGTEDDGGSVGAFFATGDHTELTRELAKLLDDPTRRKTLAARASDVVARFDWPVVAEQVQEVYLSAIAASPASVGALDEVLDQRLPAELRKRLRG